MLYAKVQDVKIKYPTRCFSLTSPHSQSRVIFSTLLGSAKHLLYFQGNLMDGQCKTSAVVVDDVALRSDSAQWVTEKELKIFSVGMVTMMWMD